MSFNKVNRVSTSFANTPSRGRINGSRFVQDQNEPRLNNVSTGSKSDGDPQSRASQAGGLNSRGTNANQPTRHAPSQGGGSDVPERAGEPEPNFLDLALEESEDDSDDSDDSDDEWEEVVCVASNTVVDRPLVAALSGFTLPTRGKRSEVLTLEVVEDWQPPSLPRTSHAVGPCTASPEDTDSTPVQELVDEQDSSLEADLQLELELAEGLADLNTPAPGPSRQPRSCTPDVANMVANASPSRPPAHNTFEAAEQSPPARASAKGEEEIVGCKPTEQPHKTGKRVNPPQVSPATEDLPARKPVVSFKKKAAELARSTGRLLVSSEPLPPSNPTIPPSSVTEGPSLVPNIPPRSRTQATPDSSRPTPQLFRSKGFSDRIQNFREKRSEATSRRFHERYGRATVERAQRDLEDSTAVNTSTGSLGTSKGRQPTQGRQARKAASGKRVSKAQAQAEEIMKICRSTKSYIVDMAAFKRREVPISPESQHPAPTIISSSARPQPIRSEKTAPTIARQQVPKTQPVVPSPIPQLPSTFLGSVPRGLKFTKKPKPEPEPGEITTETVGRVASSEWDIRGPRIASTSRENRSPAMGVSKRRRDDVGREPEGYSPWKKPRLSRS